MTDYTRETHQTMSGPLRQTAEIIAVCLIFALSFVWLWL